MGFPCIVCGLCCANAKRVPQLQSLITDNGLCRYYDADTKKCKIYRQRPDICNVDKMYEMAFSKIMSRKAFYLANLKVCYELNIKAERLESARRIDRLIQAFQVDKVQRNE